MSTFGISQNFRTPSIIGRISRMEPEKEIHIVKVAAPFVKKAEKAKKKDASDSDSEGEEEKAEEKEEMIDQTIEVDKKESRVDCFTQFSAVINRMGAKSADHF